jgi:hypothetical protein
MLIVQGRGSACHPRREIGPEADALSEGAGENPTPLESQCPEKRGSFWGAIRIPLRAPSFLFK